MTAWGKRRLQSDLSDEQDLSVSPREWITMEIQDVYEGVCSVLNDKQIHL